MKTLGMVALCLASLAFDLDRNASARPQDESSQQRESSSQEIACDDLLAADWSQSATTADGDRFRYLPSMLGDGFFAFSGSISARRTIDRLLVVADDLDAPNPLPPPAASLTITEPGPIGVFATPLMSVQQIQAILRAGQPLPGGTLQGILAEDATLTSATSVASIQTQLAATPQGYDVIALTPPPVGYSGGVTSIFVTRNGAIGQTVFNQSGSGALLQSGDDSLDGGDDIDGYYFYEYVAGVNVTSPFSAAVRSGTVKLANGGTAIPRDRLFFDYGLYSDVAFTAAGTTVNRFVPGFEKAFFDGLASFEFRLPFAATATNDLRGIVTDKGVEFGNVTMFAKALLHRSQRWIVSGGVGLTLPTAGDINLDSQQTRLVQIRNQALHLGPFLAAAFAPSDRWFCQAFLQTDFAASGNRVRVDSGGTGLVDVGSLNDANYLFTSLSIGRWVLEPANYQRPLAVIAEVHHSANINRSDEVRFGGMQIGQEASDLNVTNLTVGMTAQISDRTSVNVGLIAPLSDTPETPGSGLQARLEYRP
jgi:hypothetical protein